MKMIELYVEDKVIWRGRPDLTGTVVDLDHDHAVRDSAAVQIKWSNGQLGWMRLNDPIMEKVELAAGSMGTRNAKP